jgi:hypothetical protein
MVGIDGEKFEGLTVVIVAPTRDPAQFASLLEGHGIRVIHAAY